MKPTRLLLSAVIVIVLAIAAWQWRAGMDGTETGRVVSVGLYENAPKVYTDAHGRPAGFFIELLEEMARAERWHLDYVPCEWAQCLEELAQGRLDLMPDVAYSSERAQRFDFHRVSAVNSWSQVYVHPDLKVHAVADLTGLRVAILHGGIQQAFFTELMASGNHVWQPVPVQTLAEGYEAVAAGEADAVVTNSFFAARNGSQYMLQETPIVFLPSNLYFAAGKGRNADLLARIDVHLTAWRRDSNSIYFDALRRTMATPPEVLMPRWAIWSLGGLGIGLLSLMGLSLLLRWQVDQRTHDLTMTTLALKLERANLERLVTERTRELQALFDSASVGIVMAQDRTIVRCNRRMDELFGFAPGEQAGQSTRIWFVDEAAFANTCQDIFARIANGETHVCEQEVVRKDGSRFWARMAVRAIDADDPAQGMVSIIEDITDERAALEAVLKAKTLAEEATRMKSDFLANMSHEIRTPMNAILGMLYLALKGDLTPGLRNQLSKAQGAAHSLLGIINDILDFSKVEAGKLEIEHVEFGFDGVLEQLTDVIGPQAGQKGIEFLIRHDVAMPPMLMGDPLRIGQVLLNLCGNAVKFTEKGEVELALRGVEVNDKILRLQMCVRDSGIGMTQAVQDTLFEKFTQADQSTTRRFGGTGLGLAISKNLVELMGGRIWVEQSQPGKGTTICCTLPIEIARQPQRVDLVEQAGPLLKGIRVLVVDDNEVSREILADMLRFFHLDVVTAASGPAALAALEAASDSPCDLVLMDWRMPGMNGDEAAQRIHLDSAITHQPKVVMVTAYGREDVIRLAEQAGVDGFLIKPVSPSTLLDTILSVLGRGRILNGNRPQRGIPDAGASAQLAGARMLLVEDNDINREFATELLRSEGIEVDQAINGQEAVEQVQRQAYDGVLMDIQMPVMDGLEAARRIRALAQVPGGERFAHLPIIAMTALAMAQDAEKSQAAGMNDHITKPVAPERLVAVLAKWIQVPAERAGQMQPASHAGSLPAELLALSSLDASEGVRRIGGKLEAYYKQLRRFREHYADAVGTLRKLTADTHTQQAQEFCHALKGVTGNIGATALYACVSAIDAELKQDTLPDAATLDTAQSLLQAVMRDIDSLPTTTARASVAAPLTPDQVRERLAQLLQALQDDLGSAEPLLVALRAGVDGTPLAADIDALAAQVDVFAIDEARAQLTVLLGRLTHTT
ncbi:MAG: response regulator [Thiobacillus sp.]|uniref:response regulator n=1 Tax=Thiobacillus sp. TaxID=924 RepID=UPI0027336450|nr:response regulator [Thiobacillus sp.]MDP3586409.1 response regulator [Thiobacillus sp.]